MSDFLRYMKAKETTKAALAEYNAASTRLELARVRERLAEIVSQHNPLASLIGEDASDYREQRQLAINAARYVVESFLPPKPKEED